MSWKTTKLSSLFVASAMMMNVVSLPVLAVEPEEPAETPSTEPAPEVTPETPEAPAPEATPEATPAETPEETPAETPEETTEPTEVTFTLGAQVFDYGESVNTVNLNVGAVKEGTVTETTFTVKSSGECKPAGTVAYTDVERTVTEASETETGVTLDLACAFGGAGEGTLSYISGINQLNTVTYEIQQNEEFTLADGTVVKPGDMTFKQVGQWSDPEVEAYEKHSLDGLDYRLFVPENAADGNAHPLILWLHGAGETGAAVNPNNYSQITANRGALGFSTPEAQAKFGGAFVLAPQAPSAGRWNVDNLSKVVEIIKYLEGKYNIDADRISVSGCSMGGGGTVRIATTWPEIWNCVVPICPAVGTEATDEVIKSTMSKQNVFLVHAANDPTVNVASSRRLDSLLKYNEYYEYETVNYDGVEYPGHWSWIYVAQNDPTTADGTPIIDWMAAQTRVGEIEEGPAGASVYADEASPTGYTVDFVFDATESEKEVAKVEVSGPFNYTDKWNVINEDGTNGSSNNVDPYGFVNGMYASNAHGDGSGVWGYTAELKDRDNDGVYEVKFPIASGSYGYTYTVTYTDGTTAKMADPANEPNVDGKMNPEGNHNSGDTNSSVVKGHWDPVKQSKSPNMDYVLPIEDETKAGTMTYVPYTALDGKASHLGVYLPAGYDANRAEPYKTIYISHGGGGDETDWFHMGSADDTMDNLAAAGETEPAVIVTMDNTMYGWDYTKTLPNMLDVVIPFIEENYNVSTAVEDRALMGLSAGGMNTGEMYVEHPEAFGYFLMMSGGQTPTEWNPDYAKPIVMVSVGTVDFASRREGNNGTIAGESLGDWCEANVPDTYVGDYMYIPGSHDWFVWPQAFATWLRDVAWKDANGNEKGAKAEATAVEGNTIKFVYDDTDEKNAVKVTVAGNFQWHDPAEADQYVAMGDNSAMAQVRAEDYVEGLYNSSGLNGQEVYELTQTSGEHFELEMTVPGNLYFYDYTVTYADGTTVTVKDPSNMPKANPETGKDSGHSLIYVGSEDNCTPGQEKIYARTDGKTGTRAYVPYTAVDGTTKYLEVYLPYGYDESKTYPTLYISHGGGGNEAEWMEIGAAANIMDNLIAEGEVAPTVVVTMDNQVFGWNDDVTIPNLVDVIVPFIEKNYSVSKDPADRALCGLSMGSMFTNSVAKTCPEEFGYLGSFSGGNSDTDGTHYDAEKLNDTVLYLTAGCIDMAYNNKMGIASLDFIAMYDEIGVDYDFDVLLGAHDWGVWRESLTKFAKDYLWDVETPEEKPEDKPVKPEDKPVKPAKPGVNTGDSFNGGVFGGLMAACAALAAAAWFALKKRA